MKSQIQPLSKTVDTERFFTRILFQHRDMKKVFWGVFLCFGLLSQVCTQGASGNTKANTAWSCNRAGCSNTGGNGGAEGAGNSTSSSNQIITAPSGNPAFPTSSSYGEDISVPLLDDPYQAEAITYALKYGPTGFNVSSSGLVTWDSRDFMFDEKMDFNWGIDINYKNQIFSYSGKITTNDLNRKYPLTIGAIVVPRQEKSVVVGDFDHNGKSEILLTDNRDTIQIIEHNPNTGRYEVTWQYPYPLSVDSDPQIYSITATDINNDSYKDFIVLSYVNYQSGTKFTIIDGLTRKKIQEFADGRWYIGCESSSLSGIGATNNLICLASSRTYDPLRKLYILELPSFNTIWASPDVDHGEHFQIGNIDNDAQSEIVTSAGYIYDGLLFNNEYTYPLGFGLNLPFRLGNIVGDSKKEIIFISGKTGELAKVFDGVTYSVIGTIYDPQNSSVSFMSQIILGNLDEDEFDEVITMKSQGFGNVSAFDDLEAGGKALWKTDLSTPEKFVQNLYGLGVTDLDNDGLPDILISSDTLWTTVGDRLFVLPAISSTPSVKFTFDGREMWQPQGITGGYFANHALLFAVNSAWQPNGQEIGARFVNVNPSTGRYTFSDSIAYSASNFSIANPNGNDPGNTFLIGLKDPARHANYVNYLLTNFWSSPISTSGSQSINNIISTDLNGDGHGDFLYATSNAGAVAYDAFNATYLWQSGNSLGNIKDMAVADTDINGIKKILLLFDSKVLIFEKENNSYQLKSTWINTLQDQQFWRIFSTDLDNDSKAEIILVNSGNTICYVFSNDMQILKNKIFLNNDNLGLSEAGDIQLGAVAPYDHGILVSIGGYYSTPVIKFFDLNSGKEVWRAGPTLGPVTKNTMRFADINGDGKLKLIYGTSRSMNVTR